MSRNHNYYVYLMASVAYVIYIGVTNDLVRRVEEHKNKISEGFTKKYNCNKLVYYEHFGHINDAIYRETEIKKWRREKKVKLIESENPRWNDLYDTITDRDSPKRDRETPSARASLGMTVK